MKGWIVGLCVALMPVCAVLEWIRFRAPDQAFCKACVPKCRSTSFTFTSCAVEERWHRCPACGVEWRGRSNFGGLHDDACR